MILCTCNGTHPTFSVHVEWFPHDSFPLDFILQRHGIHAHLLTLNRKHQLGLIP